MSVEDSSSGRRPSDRMPATEESKSNTKIFTLNDDCLLQTFEYLETKDLLAISDIGDRFSSLAYIIAEKHFQADGYVRLHWGPAHREDSALMLMKFGKYITHLEMVGIMQSDIDYCNQYSGSSFATMMSSCTALTHLRLESNLYLWKFLIEEMKLPFQNTEMLEVRHWDFIERLHFIRSLKHYTFEGSYSQFGQIMPLIGAKGRLESICLKIVDFDDVETLRALFLQRLQKLKKLKRLELGVSVGHDITTHHVNILAKIDSLEELTVNLISSPPRNDLLKAIGQFVSLRVCKLHTSNDESAAIIAATMDFDVTIDHGESELYPYTITLLRKD